jgi:hypothetical protein
MNAKKALGLGSRHGGASVRVAHHTDRLSQYPDITVNPETRRLITLLTPKKLIFLRRHHSPPLMLFLHYAVVGRKAIFHPLFLTYNLSVAQPKV